MSLQQKLLHEIWAIGLASLYFGCWLDGLVATAEAALGRPATPVSYAGVARRTTVRVATPGVGAPGVGVAPGVGALGVGALPGAGVRITPGLKQGAKPRGQFAILAAALQCCCKGANEG
jgi:hypothetical protein